ncbi:MAG: tyrosine-type recombinase/integrase [bacterium]|nr:tyrosine-type recombinase/integrase [bacterium]
MRLRAAIDAYLEFVEGRSDTRKTWLRARGVLSRFYQVAGNKLLDNLTPFDVSAYLAECRRLGNKKSTRDTNVKLLSGYWKWCQESEITERRSPIRSIHRLTGVTHRPPRTLTETEQARLLLACESYAKPFERARVRAVVTIALCCGMRRGEIAGLRLVDYEQEKHQFRVLGKGSKLRIQPIPEVAIPAIETLVVVVKEKGFDRLVCTNTGRQVGEGSLHAMWSRLLRKAGVPHVPFHSCRHTYAIRFFEGGHNLKVIQALLGHASLKTTEVYLQGLDVEQAKIDAVKREFAK